MSEIERLASAICQRPGMYVGREKFIAVCAFLSGFDAARDGGPLDGFHPWMVLRRHAGNNQSWESLVLQELGAQYAEAATFSAAQDRKSITKLGALLQEFFDERRRRTATAIHHDYAKWLRRQKWYSGPLRDS